MGPLVAAVLYNIPGFQKATATAGTVFERLDRDLS